MAEPSSTTTTRMPRSVAHQAQQARNVVAHGNNDRDVAVRWTACRSRMGDCGVEQRARELRADRVVHLEPATVEHGLRGGREPQQPGG